MLTLKERHWKKDLSLFSYSLVAKISFFTTDPFPNLLLLIKNTAQLNALHPKNTSDAVVERWSHCRKPSAQSPPAKHPPGAKPLWPPSKDPPLLPPGVPGKPGVQYAPGESWMSALSIQLRDHHFYLKYNAVTLTKINIERRRHQNQATNFLVFKFK